MSRRKLVTLYNKSIIKEAVLTQNTAAPNASINASVLTPDVGTTDIDLVLAPIVAGALQVQLSDDTTVGGNKRGSRSTDFQRTRAVNDQVASGADAAILSGVNNKVTGAQSAVLCGDTNVVTHNNVAAVGVGAASKQANSHLHGVSTISTGGGGQYERIALKVQTTDATATKLNDQYSGAVSIVMDTDEAIVCIAQIVGYQRGATSNAAGYVVEFTAKRVATAASTAVIATTAVRGQENNAAWNVTVTADTTNGGININVIGAAGVTVDWIGFVQVTRVRRG